MYLSDYIKENGIKMVWLSKQLKISNSHLCKLIAGFISPSKNLADKIYEFTKGAVTTDEISDYTVTRTYRKSK